MNVNHPLGNGYESHQPPEGINVSSENPLKEFTSLILVGIVFIISIVLGLTFLTGKLAPKIPFAYEQALAERFSNQFTGVVTSNTDNEASVLSKQRQVYLEKLSKRYLNKNPLPEGMHINVHYIDDDMVNAFATLGGHIFIHRGLFDEMPSENALSFVLGHEIGHIVERHPIVSMGRGVAVVLALSAMLGVSDAALPDWLVSQTTNITMLNFSRTQEESADTYSLQGMQNIYGSVNDANALFDYFEREEEGSLLNIEVLQTHPLSDSRIQNIDVFSRAYPQKETPLIMIPSNLIRE